MIWIPFATALFTAAFGLWVVLRLDAYMAWVGIAVVRPSGRPELQSAGAAFLALGVGIAILHDADTYVLLGALWLSLCLVRTLSAMKLRDTSRYTHAAVLFELVLGAVTLAAALAA